MTWIELIYFFVSGGLTILFIIGLISDGRNPVYDFFMGVIGGAISSILIGIVLVLCSIPFWETINTAETNVNIIMEKLEGDKLVMVIDNNQLITFDKYSDIQKWKEGAKPIRSYYFTKVKFGPDRNYSEVAFK